ncbi:hypothetical protein [Paenibacillus sp. DMB5]|uniref:nucleotidyltransferase family protein n=1 Tax=Paenibacillus sp. DMB5 TaxID=1780103 RepID=UPI00076CD6EA|nr:hypothetical protein [Paenibacillus sp. DMB5]KUP22056.1 hypothetical protein AWJ19_21335 [Paenibacillus sp. DMB5]
MNSFKSSKQYFTLLDKLLTKYDAKRMESLESPALIQYLAKKVSWFLSRLLRLQDNDLWSYYEGFDFVEVLYLCGNLYDLNERPINWNPKDVARFKELLLKVREYSAVRSSLVQKNVIDSIITYQDHIGVIAAAHGVKQLKLYGSVLSRTEKPDSNIDFLAIFDPNIPYQWDATFEMQGKLEAMLNRRISILDSRRVPEVFRPQIDTDPIDIMQLEACPRYSITPKSSKLYFIMLNKLFKEYDYDIDSSGYANTSYACLADRISWWFSRLLRFEDNDLQSHEGFDFTEVLYICNKLYYEVFDQSPEDIIRFKELLPAIKGYVAARFLQYK